MKSKFERKTKKFLNFIEGEIMGDFYYIESDENTYHIRLVPFDFDIEKIPKFKRLCKKVGLKCRNDFNTDEKKTKGYRDWHECYLENDGNFLKEFTMEDLQ